MARKNTLPIPDLKEAFQVRLNRLYTILSDVLAHDHGEILAVGASDTLLSTQTIDSRSSKSHLRRVVLVCAHPPDGVGLLLTVGDALKLSYRSLDGLAYQMATEVRACFPLLSDARLAHAILNRPVLVDRWPKPHPKSSSGAFALYGLISILRNLIPHERYLCSDYLWGDETEQISPFWLVEVSGLHLFRWAYQPLERLSPGAADRFAHHLFQMRVPTDLEIPFEGKVLQISPLCLMALYLAERDVKSGMNRNSMAIDAGSIHHDMVQGWRDIPRDGRRHRSKSTEVERKTYQGTPYIELLAPGGAVQLELPLEQVENPTEPVIVALRKLRGAEGLRHWAALLRLFSVEGGRKKYYRWYLDEHLQAMGYDERRRRDPELQEHTRQIMAFLISMEIAVYHESGKLRLRRPLLLRSGQIDLKKEGIWLLDGIELQINEKLYEGVRQESGEIGRNWMPTPIELAQIDHVRFPYAHALGLMLAIRLRWRLNEGSDVLSIKGKNLLELAGVSYDSERDARVWETMQSTLDELVRIGQIQRYRWKTEAEAWTMDGVCQILNARWVTDRVMGLVPIEEPVQEDRPHTGAELAEWRKKKNFSQREAAKWIGVSAMAISKAESKPDETLGHKIRAFFKVKLKEQPALSPDDPHLTHEAAKCIEDPRSEIYESITIRL